MHQYLSAIGFKDFFTREYEIDLLLSNLLHTYDFREATREETTGTAFLEMSKVFGPGMGIRLCGQMDGQGFHRTYYFPYFDGSKPTVTEEVAVRARTGGDGYQGMIQENDFVGLAVIFYLQNPALFIKNSFRSILSPAKVPVTLTGLSKSGVILLPGKPGGESIGLIGSLTGEGQAESERAPSASEAAGEKTAAAQTESETDEMDIFAMLSRRVQKEDVYSIVESSFMPAGMECDQYRVIGTILFYTKVQNVISKQYVYQFTLLCNGVELQICINEQDLLGDPDVGRRFKGSIWLQGKPAFSLPESRTKEKSAAAGQNA